jgi:hypothetical protein
MTNYYKRYCRILTNVIKLAKKRYYNNILNSSSNKTKTAWNIIKKTTNIKPNTHNIIEINVNGNSSSNGQIIAESFNKYVVSVAHNLHVNNQNIKAPASQANPITYLSRAFNHPFPTIRLKYVSSKEIEDMTMSLKITNSHGYDGIS